MNSHQSPVTSHQLKKPSYNKILIIRLDRIGDVVLSTPAMRAIREAYPASHIACMVRPHAADIVMGSPYIDEVLIYDKDGAHKGLRGTLSFAGALRRSRFDAAVILHPTGRTHIIAFLAGIPERIGYDKKWGFLLTKRLPHLKQLGMKHESEYTLDIVRHMGIEPKDLSLYMPLSPESEKKIDSIFAGNGIRREDTVIVLNPGASCPSKRWPCKNFAQLGEVLCDRFRAKIVVAGGKGDVETGKGVAGSMKAGVLDLSGKTTVADLASIFRRSKLLISNDSGPVHIACAVGTPVVAIFGRNDRGLSPVRWGPSGKGDIVLHKDVGCGVCLAHNCKIGFKCLEAVTVEEVVAAAGKILKIDNAK
ncbi:MAG: lipopolysaccharide heptosyltransferase II [Candidatus Omnitrophota bacterium]